MATNLKLASFFFAMLCNCSLQTTGAVENRLELVLYTHEMEGGANPTLLAAAGTSQGNLTGIGWGSFMTVDNKLKEGPLTTSKTVGRFTGFAAITTIDGMANGGLLALDQFRFTEGMYNGSVLNVMGMLGSPADGPWELTVVGGTGFFRGVTGYAISRPYHCAPASSSTGPLFVFEWHIMLRI